MSFSITSGQIKYVFSQATAPSGEGEVAGSLWYDTVTKVLSFYDGTSWISTSTSSGTGHITIVPFNYSAIIAGTWVWGLNTNSIYSGVMDHTTTAQNDEIHYQVYLAAGTYTIGTISIKNTDLGIATVKLNTTTIGTLDYYVGSITYNNRVELTSISVTASGLYTLKFLMATKNASSSAYGFKPTMIYLYRTA